MIKTKLPSLNGLQTFECVARFLSFKDAANELCLTPSAVSKQIKLLEDYLGYRLFHRLNRQIILTEEGKQLLETVTSALSILGQGVKVVAHNDSDKLLTLSVPPSFAMKWLIPRLQNFKLLHTDIILNIEVESKYIDLRESKVDIAIRYGAIEESAEFKALLLMDEVLFPVCSPTLFAEADEIKHPKDLSAYCLLHTPEKMRWKWWLKQVGCEDLKPKSEMYPGRADLAIQAAIEGQGVMIARSALVADDIEAGKLVRLFDYELSDKKSYSIHYLNEHSNKTKIKVFKNWIHEQARQFK